MASEAQRRANKKWNENNKERVRQIHNDWLDNNRERVNEQTARRANIYYYQKKAVSYECAVKELFKINL